MQESYVSKNHLKILNLLKRAAGRHISGETISKKVRVSRAAIWKYVSALRKYGYKITSKQGSGYRLVSFTKFLLPWEVGGGLETTLMGREIYHYMLLDSTQDVAIRLAERNAPEGTVVVAETQKKGRARVGRRWMAPAGGIWLSVILRPKLPAAESTILPLVGALAVCNAIRKEYGLDARLKWPNDVVIGAKKVSGVLAEMSSEADRINYVVLGVGINANIDSKRLEKTVRGTKGFYGATSLMDELGTPVERITLLRRVLAEVEELYNELWEEGRSTLIEKWKEHSATLGTTVTVSLNGASFVGRAVDLDYDGALLVRLPNGDIKRVIAGDVYVRASRKLKARTKKRRVR